MKKVMMLVVLPVALGLTACGADVVMMGNPKTGQVARCENTVHPFFPIWRATIGADAQKRCVTGYESMGWKQMP